MNPEENLQNPVPSTPTTSGKSLGPAIGVLIIIIVVILGGLYFWGQRISAEKNLEENTADRNAEEEIEAMRVQGTSDDLGSIETDLENTDTESLGGEMDTIEAESSGSLQAQ